MPFERTDASCGNLDGDAAPPNRTSGHNGGALISVPVSYTHLDVYKRQVLFGSR